MKSKNTQSQQMKIIPANSALNTIQKTQTNTESLILAVDTSCDDTAAAVLRGRTVLSNVIASQTQLHKKYGGVYPTVAKQAHKEKIQPTILAALKKAHVKITNLSALAITVGPGLAPALEVGISAVKALAEKHKIPLIAVNHIEGHALSALALQKPRLNTKQNPTHAADFSSITYPVLSVVVSGGHTQFIYFTEIGKYEILGTTIDDAAGECLDKIGRMLNLGYPAGPIIEKFAKKGNPETIAFPLPMTAIKTYDMSFSGMKTFARNYIQKFSEENTFTRQEIYDFCASAQYAVFRHISYKLSKLLQNTPVAEIWLGGGVAQNKELRRTIREAIKKQYAYEQAQQLLTGSSTITAETKTKQNSVKKRIQKIVFRHPYNNRLCMDNAAMIGLVAYFKYIRGEYNTDINTIERKPRWEIGTEQKNR